MTLEDLDKVLQHPNIVNTPVVEEPGKLCRDRSFTIDGQQFSIEWWCNMIYLRHGGVLVAAESVAQSGTWPNHAKLNLQFQYDGKTVAIIELEKYEEGI